MFNKLKYLIPIVFLFAAGMAIGVRYMPAQKKNVDARAELKHILRTNQQQLYTGGKCGTIELVGAEDNTVVETLPFTVFFEKNSMCSMIGSVLQRQEDAVFLRADTLQKTIMVKVDAQASAATEAGYEGFLTMFTDTSMNDYTVEVLQEKDGFRTLRLDHALFPGVKEMVIEYEMTTYTLKQIGIVWWKKDPREYGTGRENNISTNILYARGGCTKEQVTGVLDQLVHIQDGNVSLKDTLTGYTIHYVQ